MKTKNFFYSKTFFISVMLAPMLLHLLVFWLGVQIESIAIAFQDQDGSFTLMNFVNVVRNLSTAEGGILVESLRNTMLFFLMGLCSIPLYLFFAYMIYKKMFGYKYVRMCLYLPQMISSFMMAIMYQQFLATDGPLLAILNGRLNMGIPTPIIMEAPLIEIMIFDLWIGIGANLVLWLGAMGRIPMDLLESASLDGITPVKEFTKIVFPLIWPTFTTFVTLSFVGIFGASGSILYFTEGNYGTSTLSFYMWNIVYRGQSNQYGVGAALGLLITFATIPLVVLSRMFINRFGEEVEY